MTTTLTVDTPTDTEVVMTRVFDAPRELVYEAMTTAEHIREWWGWSDWTMTECSADFTPGGTYRFVSRSPEGQEVAFRGRCLEADRPARIVYEETYEAMDQLPPALVTTTFEESGGRTTVTVRVDYRTREIRDAVLATGMETGAAHSYDRLAALLKRLA